MDCIEEMGGFFFVHRVKMTPVSGAWAYFKGDGYMNVNLFLPLEKKELCIKILKKNIPLFDI